MKKLMSRQAMTFLTVSDTVQLPLGLFVDEPYLIADYSFFFSEDVSDPTGSARHLTLAHEYANVNVLDHFTAVKELSADNPNEVSYFHSSSLGVSQLSLA